MPVLIFDPKPDQRTARPPSISMAAAMLWAGQIPISVWRRTSRRRRTAWWFRWIIRWPRKRTSRSLWNRIMPRWPGCSKMPRQFGVDPARIAIWATARAAAMPPCWRLPQATGSEFKIAYQCLIYPMLDDRTGSTHRMPPHMGHFVWTEAANRFGWSSLLGVPAGSASAPPGLGSRPRGKFERACRPPSSAWARSISSAKKTWSMRSGWFCRG